MMETSMDTSAGLAGICVGLVGLLIALAVFAFWLWMLIDAIKHTPSENNLRLIWILVIILAGVIGALVYFFVQRPKNPKAG
jgi:prolipoprotein diacylglyceryltransferase